MLRAKYAENRLCVNDIASLHASQILRDLGAMQAVEAELSGYTGKFRCFLQRRVQRQFVSIHLFYDN
jgi:hypothetical protein